MPNLNSQPTDGRMTMTNQMADVVELLGQLWLHEVSLETLSAMQDDRFRASYVELGGFVPPVVDQTLVESLAVEYCQLFVGPRDHLSPVQSIWVENQFQSPTAGSMNRYFELIPEYCPASSLSDHLGVQLDFLAVVYRQPDRDVADEIARRFGNDHLNWAIKYLNRVELQATSEFYQGLAKVTRQLVPVVCQGVEHDNA